MVNYTKIVGRAGNRGVGRLWPENGQNSGFNLAPVHRKGIPWFGQLERCSPTVSHRVSRQNHLGGLQNEEVGQDPRLHSRFSLGVPAEIDAIRTGQMLERTPELLVLEFALNDCVAADMQPGRFAISRQWG
jgi:hypothetical protein